jgi:hypothetical protein
MCDTAVRRYRVRQQYSGLAAPAPRRRDVPVCLASGVPAAVEMMGVGLWRVVDAESLVEPIYVGCRRSLADGAYGGNGFRVVRPCPACRQ